MTNTVKIVSVIPARGGSKGIPRKNLICVNGFPLIKYTIDASLRSKYISKTIVSSDDDEILAFSSLQKAHVIKRSAEFAMDHSSSESVILHVLSELKKNNELFDVLVLLQPTSPLRTETDIDNAFRVYFENNATALISVYEPDHSPFKSFKLNSNGFLEGLINNETPFMPRQSLPKTFFPNGAIFIVDVNEFYSHKSFLTNRTIPYIMEPEKSVDVDSINDIIYIEKYLKAKQ